MNRVEVQDRLITRLRETVRTLIVDEVYDANSLDLTLIHAVAASGADVTIIGDPWQALYGFRGARPDMVPKLIADIEMITLPLSQSFRWRSEEQKNLADKLRAGYGLTLPEASAEAGFDVVLASVWDDLWTAGERVLPLAWGSPKGNFVEAATTLLLNQATRDLLNLEAIFLPDALATLGITDKTSIGRLEAPFAQLLDALGRATTMSDFDDGYHSLIAAIRQESGRDFPARAHRNYTNRLRQLARRLSAGNGSIPGMTVHQAKGREWDRVGIRLSERERAILSGGLDPSTEDHRPLYVACTRARYKTAELRAAIR
jgi:DNA helicase-2/ATP-dependent DNA helicase PcrA